MIVPEVFQRSIPKVKKKRLLSKKIRNKTRKKTRNECAYNVDKTI